MKARLVIDDVTVEPHEFVICGKTYDLQKTFTVTKAMMEHTENGGADVDIPLVALVAMMNDCAVRSGGELPKVTAEEVRAWIPADKYMEITEFVRGIINPESVEKVDTSELDDLIDAEIPEDVQKN